LLKIFGNQKESYPITFTVIFMIKVIYTFYYILMKLLDDN